MEYVITLEQLGHFALPGGDTVHALEGYRHGLEHASLLWSVTPPGGGPPSTRTPTRRSTWCRAGA